MRNRTGARRVRCNPVIRALPPRWSRRRQRQAAISPSLMRKARTRERKGSFAAVEPHRRCWRSHHRQTLAITTATTSKKKGLEPLLPYPRSN